MTVAFFGRLACQEIPDRRAIVAVEHDPSFWEQAFKWAWAVIGALMALIWGMLNSKINGKASKESVDTLSDEMGRQRDNITKIFDKLEDLSNKQHDSHTKIMEAIHANSQSRR